MAAVALENYATEPGEINVVFSAAHQEFLSTLSDVERANFAKCDSVEELVKSCQNFGVIMKLKRRGLPFIKRIKDFGHRLSPYFKIIEILCASNPGWSNIALGAFRLVLSVSLTCPETGDDLLIES